METPGKAPAAAVVSDDASPFHNANLLSRVFFHWATPLFVTGYRRPLNQEDLFPIRNRESGQECAQRLRTAWETELAARPEDPQLLRACVSVWRRQYGLSLVWFIIWLIASIAGSGFLLRELLQWVEDPDGRSRGYAVGLTIGVAAFELMKATSMSQQWFNSFLCGLQMRAAVRMLVFEKATTLRKGNMQVGDIVTLCVNDAQRMQDAGMFLMFLGAAPIVAIVVVVALIFMLGPAVLAGFAVLLFLLPIQRSVGGRIAKLRRQVVPHTQRRTSLLNELLNGMKLVKLYAWEKPFADTIEAIRKLELSRTLRAAWVRAFIAVLSAAAPVLSTLVTFAVHVTVTGDALQASDAFAVLALFNVLRFPLFVLPLATRNFSEAVVALRRVSAFMTTSEMETGNAAVSLDSLAKDSPGGDTPAAADAEGLAICVRNASFQWGTDEAPPGSAEGAPPADGPAPFTGLRDINVSIRQGELIGVVGLVGAGKSSFLAALLGQMLKTKGFVGTRGRVGYTAQRPTIFNQTLRDNVLFGLPFDAAKFKRVCRVSALGPDIAQLSAGDMTEIGERGITLSGGQQARVAVARCLYSKPDLCLLDDPLSAVDVHVGRHLWKYAITGELKHATRIVVTHQVQFLPMCDRVMVLANGAVAHFGTHDELVAAGVDFRQLSSKPVDGSDSEEGAADGDSGDDLEEAKLGDVELEKVPEPGTASPAVASMAATPFPGAPRIRAPSDAQSSLPSGGPASPLPGTSAPADGTLIKEEERKVGSVSISTLGKYASAAGPVKGAIVLLLFLLAVVCRTAVDVVLARWVDDAADKEDEQLAVGNTGDVDQNDHILRFGIAAVVVMAVTLARSFLFATTTNRAAANLHAEAFARVVHAKNSYFDTTPLGRILNRFSGDLDLIDTRLPETMETALHLFNQCFISVVIIGSVFPFFLLVMIPVVVLFVFIARYFKRNSRELKRLEGISRSPLVSNVQATMQGIDTIRAYGLLDTYIARNRAAVDANSAAFFSFYTVNRWVSVRLDSVVVGIVLVTGLFTALSTSSFDPGDAGLSLIYALQLGGIFQFMVRQTTETESMLTSVERLSVPVPQEEERWAAPGQPAVEAVEPPSDWPQEGAVAFNSTSVRYRDGLPLVLRGVNIEVAPGYRVGIVGRTGSGKSTTALTLFRMLELSAGSISIDGINIGNVAVQTLRSRLSIIPQDPVLFSGTVRSNLDPFNSHTDAAMLDCLDHVNLRAFCEEEGGLDKVVEENGTNFSQGQRQLLALARALLKRARVVVLDEATASVDTATDSTVQTAVRQHLAGSTMLIIAHRLDTICDCDRILGLERGVVVEYAPPAVLLGMREAGEGDVAGAGLFKSLVDETGEETAAALGRLVSEADARR